MDWNSILTALFLTQLLGSSIRLATPLVLAALGEIFAERAGVLNLGVEGIMLFSGFAGFSAAYQFKDPRVGLLVAVLVGALMGLLFAFMTVTLRSNQVVTGLALMFLCNGLAIYSYRLEFKISRVIPRVATFPALPLPVYPRFPLSARSSSTKPS